VEKEQEKFKKVNLKVSTKFQINPSLNDYWHLTVAVPFLAVRSRGGQPLSWHRHGRGGEGERERAQNLRVYLVS
jgi:hypothetical protein